MAATEIDDDTRREGCQSGRKVGRQLALITGGRTGQDGSAASRMYSLSMLRRGLVVEIELAPLPPNWGLLTFACFCNNGIANRWVEFAGPVADGGEGEDIPTRCPRWVPREPIERPVRRGTSGCDCLGGNTLVLMYRPLLIGRGCCKPTSKGRE